MDPPDQSVPIRTQRTRKRCARSIRVPLSLVLGSQSVIEVEPASGVHNGEAVTLDPIGGFGPAHHGIRKGGR